MKKVTFLILIALAGLLCMGADDCEGKNRSNQVLDAKQEQVMNEANAEVGMPAIKNFQERKLARMVLELRDQENLMCYAYIVAEYSGELKYIGRCIGFGLPYATQYTNPMRPINGYPAVSQESTIPQADPNGLFMPGSAEGTWLMMVDPKTGKPSPCYFEPRVVVSPFDLKGS